MDKNSNPPSSPRDIKTQSVLRHAFVPATHCRGYQMKKPQSLQERLTGYFGGFGAAVGSLYLVTGALCAVPTFISTVLFYTSGPGAPCNGGFIACSLATGVGFAFHAFASMFRVVLWPIGLYTVATTDLSLWEWINYLWYPGK